MDLIIKFVDLIHGLVKEYLVQSFFLDLIHRLLVLGFDVALLDHSVIIILFNHHIVVHRSDELDKTDILAHERISSKERLVTFEFVD